MPAGGLYRGAKRGPRRSELQKPQAGLPKAPGLQDQGADRDSLKALYMQKKDRRVSNRRSSSPDRKTVNRPSTLGRSTSQIAGIPPSRYPGTKGELMRRREKRFGPRLGGPIGDRLNRSR